MEWFTNLRKWLKGKKTYTTVAAGAVVIVYNFLSSDIPVGEFLQSGDFKDLLQLVGLGTIRAGVKAGTGK